MDAAILVVLLEIARHASPSQIKLTTDMWSLAELRTSPDVPSRHKSMEPESVRSYVEKGLALYRAGRYQQAINNYDKALEIRPSAVVYYNRGNAHYALAQFTAAIKDFTEAIQNNLGNALAYMNRGIAHSELGNFGLALTDLNTAVNALPTNANAYYNRGLVFMRRGDLTRAIADFSVAVRIDPEHANAFSSRAAARQKLGMLPAAIDDYFEALRLDRNNRNALVNLKALGFSDYWLQQACNQSIDCDSKHRRGSHRHRRSLKSE